MRISPLHVGLLSVWALALAASGYHSYDLFTWILEVSPAVIGIVLLIVTYRRFRLTNLLYLLIFAHSLILMLGGHYSYARVPLGFWMEDIFGFTRNNYDRIGHFAQGVVPAWNTLTACYHSLSAAFVGARRGPINYSPVAVSLLTGQSQSHVSGTLRVPAARISLALA